MNRSYTLIIFLLLCAVIAAPAQEPDYRIIAPSHPKLAKEIPWRVQKDKAFLRTNPSKDAEVKGILMHDEEVQGDVVLVKQSDEEWLRVDLGEETCFVTMTALHRVHPDNVTTGTLTIGAEVVDRWWGLPVDYEAADLEYLPGEYTDGRTQRLRREAADALMKMFDAARADGVAIVVGSSYRSGARQQSIYNNAVERDGYSQRYSAPPGHSEHQLGTTVDLSDPAKRYYLEQSFSTTPQGEWLRANAHKYGFLLTYPPEGLEHTGYVFEPWHFRYWGVQKATAAWKARNESAQ